MTRKPRTWKRWALTDGESLYVLPGNVETRYAADEYAGLGDMVARVRITEVLPKRKAAKKK